MVAGRSPRVARLISFLFPAGEDAARRIRAIRNTQTGEMRTGPRAPWVPFTSEETIDATRTRFRWDARLEREGAGAAIVTDAYEDGHGWGAARAAGASTGRRAAGPEFDRGELQRYLASLPLCPPMLLANSDLLWEEVPDSAVRLRDRSGPAASFVDVEIREDGCPIACRADRPRTVGTETVPTAWSTAATDFREWEGLRIAHGLEASWHPAEGGFLYVRSAVASFVALF